MLARTVDTTALYGLCTFQVSTLYTCLHPVISQLLSATVVIIWSFASVRKHIKVCYLKFVISTASLDPVPRAIAICFPSWDQANHTISSETKCVSGCGAPPEGG